MFYSVILSSYYRNVMSGESQRHHKCLYPVAALQTMNLKQSLFVYIDRDKYINIYQTLTKG